MAASQMRSKLLPLWCTSRHGMHVDALPYMRALHTSALCSGRSPFNIGGRRNVPPLMPEGMDWRERHHCGPADYHGRTPAEIIARFKDLNSFPWYRIPQKHRTQRFEELYQLAHKCRVREAMDTIKVLTDPAYDKKDKVVRR
eukprot:gnl/MRDRNA2_/MRDRNA2_153240_c0_seq1.p1 gnl/MRDRNA2_/MRDRNA2_153240_c0~~gnl/MRDRNA2_/MRDRNA2_153240_c0_seq1.p1  ORF type:complete len:159 (-),score=24.26 gnl/MRDRNA2_/MRDRNA2_153240_c0_seq1:88-513(-)